MALITDLEDFYNEEHISYLQPERNLKFDGKDIFVISDLHMAEGLDQCGNYNGNENFFADASFARFIDNLIHRTQDSALLVINGDFIDFLRICSVPNSPEAFESWHSVLNAIGITRTVEELKSGINKKEKKYGLKTDDYKSVWRLNQCVSGHPAVFDSLAKWLSVGNSLLITKGNHDLEWYWQPVRKYLNVILATRVAVLKDTDMLSALKSVVLTSTCYADQKVVINDWLYVEHGHQYERFTSVDGPPVLKGCEELNLPFGSFFNRYLINRVELAYPYIDNVRPRENILAVLVQERFPLAIKLLFNYVPFAFMVIPKRKYAYALKYLLQFLSVIIVPLLLTVLMLWRYFWPMLSSGAPTGVWKPLIAAIQSVGMLLLSYLFARLFAILQLSSPGSLFKNAQAALIGHPDVKVVTFGHTHDPEQLRDLPTPSGYFNTGTWIPVIETTAAEVRFDKTYILLHLSGGTGKLLRWNDDAMRLDELQLFSRK